jgi:FixJ family two-component response regulator
VETLPWIAIVDDDPFVLRALARLLRTRRLRPKTFGSGEDFLGALSEGRPDCLIVDMQMPEMSGLELQQHLTRRGISIPTIVITAHGDAQARERCVAAGAVAFLTKPLQEQSLFAAIQEASTQPRSDDHGAA